METVTAKSYTLRDANGGWLGQIVLTSDGAFMGLTDWGNFNFAWRSHGHDDFRKFLVGLGIDYFATKMYQGMQYIHTGAKLNKSCQRFAEKILPALQEVLKKELASEVETHDQSLQE